MNPQEKRSSPRREISLQARLIPSPGQTLSCEIADFCAEGLFVKFSPHVERQINQHLEQTGRADMSIAFREELTQRLHELKIRVVRQTRGAVGVQFTHSNPEAVDAMLKLCTADNKLQSAALAPKSDRAQFILRQCSRAMVEFIEPLMKAYFPALTDKLHEAAQEARSDQQANELIDGVGLVNKNARATWSEMLVSLEAPLKAATKPVKSEDGESQGISLVDKGEFEDWLNVRVMVTKAEAEYRDSLLRLKLRLDNLGISNETGHKNPLGPSLVSESFSAAMQSWDASRAVEKVCFKVFENRVLLQLGELYETLNEILIRQGVLPNLDLNSHLRKVSSVGKRPASSAPSEPKPSEAPKEQPPTAATKPPSGETSATRPAERGQFSNQLLQAQTAFATVRNLLSTLAAQRQSAGGSMNGPTANPVVQETPPELQFPADAPVIQGTDLHQQLQALQVTVLSQEEELRSLKERVIRSIKESGEQRLDDGQQETLDIVDRFFRSVVDNPKISDRARHLMRQLEVPVFKVALRDDSFFEDTESPVRGVMNRLAQWGVKGARVSPVTQRRIDELVHRIVEDFEEDQGVFQDAAEELDSLIERQNLVFRRNAERVSAAAEGAQRVIESKQAVQKALNDRIAGQSVPRALVSLLDAGWRDLLSLTWLRQGPESSQWYDYLTVVDELMTFAQDPDGGHDLRETLRLIQDGLASISSNQIPAAKVREELKQLVVREPGQSIPMVEMPGDPEVSEAAPEEPKLTEREKARLGRWIERAKKLRSGDWLRNQTEPENPTYVRLVWIAEGFKRFVFVNHQGMRVVELGLEALAAQLQSGLLIPDDQYEVPLVDESIDRMVRNVYDQLSWASSHDEMTGLMSRREFERSLEQLLSTGARGHALIRVDLRQFRLLNNAAGSNAGDMALRQVSDIIRSMLDEEAPAARLAGDEFAFVTSEDQAESRAEALIQAIESMKLEHDQRQFKLSASVGIAPDNSTRASAERWLRASEDALKAAKKEGNGRVVVHQVDARDQRLQDQIAAKVATLDSMDRERMLMRSQKIEPMRLDTQVGPHYETLIGMFGDDGKLIPSSELVRTASRYGRLQVVDRWVVRKIVDWLADWNPQGKRRTGLLVKLSGASLNQEELLQDIVEQLENSKHPVDKFWLEISEANEIADLRLVGDYLRRIKEFGGLISLSRFGSGPKSYQLMRALPVDMIKIDSEFTDNALASDVDQAMIRSIVDMAHFLKREVVATKVESRQALEMLRHLGVDYAQGYVVERPQLLNSLK